MKPTEAQEPLRLDKWLWSCRFYKTRSLATEAIKSGKVLVNGHKIKPARHVHLGEEVFLKQEHRHLKVEVVQLLTTRTNAPQAQAAYKILEEKLLNTSPAGQIIFAQRDRGAGRPTKKERRQQDSWRDLVD